MSGKKRDRRFSIGLPIVAEIRLSLWAHTRSVSKTRMAEAILVDRVSNTGNWSEVCKDLRQEAAIHKLEVEELIKDILKSDGYSEVIDVDGIDWRSLVNKEESRSVEESSDD